VGVHPHIQRRGPGHWRPGRIPKVSYPTRQAALGAAGRRYLSDGRLMKPYSCGDHWHLETRHPGRDSWARDFLVYDLELGERAAAVLRAENENRDALFAKLARTVAVKRAARIR
jgi:hypothetical protein